MIIISILMSFFGMENSLNNNKTASSGSFRPRKSIFSSTKAKQDYKETKASINR